MSEGYRGSPPKHPVKVPTSAGASVSASGGPISDERIMSYRYMIEETLTDEIHRRNIVAQDLAVALETTLAEVSRLRAVLTETTLAEVSRLRAVLTQQEAVLRRIQEWDCLNPPRPDLCADHPWLKRLVDDALAGVRSDG